jgi:hypothetical protein
LGRKHIHLRQVDTDVDVGVDEEDVEEEVATA